MIKTVTERKPVCLIPARGGSKRFPRKNIANLDGKPLIAWTIQAALDSSLFDRLWVSSEDLEILKVAEKWGGTPLKRSKELAGDQVALELVCREAIDILFKKGFDYTDLYLMLPTSPFRKRESILQAWETFVESGADSLMSVIEYSHPPQWAMYLNDEKCLFPYDWKGFYSERQQLVSLCRHDGAYFISNISMFLDKGVLMGPKTVSFYSSAIESLDIDEPMDLLWAEFLMKKREIE